MTSSIIFAFMGAVIIIFILLNIYESKRIQRKVLAEEKDFLLLGYTFLEKLIEYCEEQNIDITKELTLDDLKSTIQSFKKFDNYSAYEIYKKLTGDNDFQLSNKLKNFALEVLRFDFKASGFQRKTYTPF